MDDRHRMGDDFGVRARKSPGLCASAAVKGRWQITCRDKDGGVKWTDVIENLVTNEGLNYLLDAGLSGGSQTTSWYIGLTAADPTADAGDTMSSHSGWTEVTAYDEATRVQWVDGGVGNQTVSNSDSPAEFTISQDSTTVGGAFLTSSNQKGGTTGTLYAVGAFSGGNKSLDEDDTLSVTATFTAAAAT